MPSPKNPSDPDFNRFDFRPKVENFQPWKGVSLNGDTASGQPNVARYLINVRSNSEGYVPRGGLTKGASNAATGDLDGIWEAGDIGAIDAEAIDGSDVGTPFCNMYVMGLIASQAYGYFTHVDTASQTVVTSDPDDSARPTAVPIDYDGMQVGGVQHGETTGEVLSLPDLTSLFALPQTGTQGIPFSLVAVGTNLWVSWYDSGVGQGARVSLWNGVSLTSDFLVAGQDTLVGGSVLGKLGSTPYLGLHPSALHITNNIYKRTGAGAWSAIALPGCTWFQATHMLEYSGKLWIIGVDDVNLDNTDDRLRIYSYDGATITLEHSIVLVTTHPHIVAQLGIVGSNLYYWYHDGGDGSSFSRLGKYDGAVFTDVYKDLGSIAALYLKGMGFVASDDGADVMYFDNTGDFYIWESPGTDLAGAWTLVLSPTVGFNATNTLVLTPLAGLVAS